MKFVIYFSALGLFMSSALASASIADDNKKIVTSFYNMVFIKRQPIEAVNLYMGSTYTQHNPHVPDGKEAFLGYFVPFFKSHTESKAEIKHAVAEGDLVVLHVLSKKTASDRGTAVVDMFRVENGKIVEHWDVQQEIPEKTANTNTMF
jgi:predicted SnoaL-like aldol condensation-catalyzing enzyme